MLCCLFETVVTWRIYLESDVYLYLETVEEASITDLQSTLNMQQLALFPVLNTLEGEDLIERDSEIFTVAA